MEITPFLDDKLSHRFHTIDTDGDGFVERSDFEVPVERLGAEFGVQPTSRADAPVRAPVGEPGRGRRQRPRRPDQRS